MVNPYAVFDCLSVGARLQSSLDNFAEAEIHLFSYLGCLLSLYRQRPVSDWNYKFTGTKNGSPFSTEINEAFKQLYISGFLEIKDEYYKLSDKGLGEYNLLKSLTQNANRDVFIDGACASLLSLPVGFIRNALSNEPEIKRVFALSTSRWLLEEERVESLYEQFASLSAAIGIEIKDLMVPAIVWLKYLTRTSENLQPAP